MLDPCPIHHTGITQPIARQDNAADITIRSIDPYALDGLKEVRAQAVLQRQGQYGIGLYLPLTVLSCDRAIARLRKNLKDKSLYRVLVAEIGARPVGYLAGDLVDGHRAVIETMFTLPSPHQTGRRLLREFEAQARDKGYTAAEAEATPSAVGFFSRMGYTMTRPGILLMTCDLSVPPPAPPG